MAILNMKSAGSHKSQPLVAEEVFYIVGPSRLKNELISYCLEREIGARCLICENISEISGSAEKNFTERPRLAFLDCQGKDPQQLLVEFDLCNEKALSGVHFVLIHVPNDFGFEGKLVGKGVRGFLYDQDPLEWILKGTQAVLKGELWLSREKITKYILGTLDPDDGILEQVPSLTPREVQILALVATWATNEEIADKLFISVHTVKNHLYNIFKKIGTPNRRQAALWATKNLQEIIPKY